MKKMIILWVWFMFALIAGKGTNYRLTQDANIRREPSKKAEISYTATSGATFLGKKENDEWIKIKEFEITTNNSDGTSSTGSVYGYIHNSLVEKKFNWTRLIKTLFWLYVIFAFFSAGVERQCPSCKKLFARKKLGKTFVDSDEDYDTVTRVDTIKNRRGETIATKERQEQVHMTTNYYRVDCRCKKCGHEWYYITSHRFEG